jgi:hypothetical protein
MAIPNDKLQYVAFSSDFNYENIHMKGSITTTLGAAETSVTHGLGYTPYARVWQNWGAAFQIGAQSPTSDISVIWSVDNTKLYVQAFANLEGSFGNSVTLHYRIYKEQNV